MNFQPIGSSESMLPRRGWPPRLLLPPLGVTPCLLLPQRGGEQCTLPLAPDVEVPLRPQLCGQGPTPWSALGLRGRRWMLLSTMG